MRTYAAFVILLALVVQWGCSRTILVPVPPRMDLKSYGTLGIIEFASNSDPAISNYATQQFQEHVQGAYPGTPILELGNREAVLAAVGATQFDADAIAKIGKKYGVTAVFLGDIVYSEPKTDIRLTDINKLEGGVRTEVRGDISTKLMETQSGASVWSSSAWAKRQIGSVSLSTKRGVSATVGDSNPRKDMVPALILHLTQDFRPKLVRQRAP
ncbi:MAG: hypothetical protein E8D49_12450 [Nitrospira sp.]|nr:MAG: hypothetical protein E8D49_12450 [Nitrospira sp.]